MTHAQAIQEMIHHAEQLVDRADNRQAIMLLDKILRLDFTNPSAWQLLYKLLGAGQPFEGFQRTYAQEHYPARAHLLGTQAVEPHINSRPVSAATEGAIELCQVCGKSNRAGARFCTQCGAPLTAGQSTPIPPQASASALPSSPVGQPVNPQAPVPGSAPSAPPLQRIPQPQSPVYPPPTIQSPPPTPPLQPPAAPVYQPPAPLAPPPPLQPLPERTGSDHAGGEVVCPDCGRANPRDARLCAYCGYRFSQPPDLLPSQKADKRGAEKTQSRFRLHFVDLGLFVIVISMLLPWGTIDRSTFIGSSSQIYDGFGIIAEFGGGANLNIAVILFFILGVAAYILVRAHNKILATIAAVASLVAQSYVLVTMLSISDQSVGNAGMFFDLSSLEVREGTLVALVGAILTLLGVIFYEGAGFSGFLKRSWKRILIVLAILFLCFAGWVAFMTLQAHIREMRSQSEYSTRTAPTFIPKTQTSSVKTETAATLTPRASTDLKDYQIVYVGAADSGSAPTAVWVANGDGSDQRLVYRSEYDLFGAYFSQDRSKIIFYGINRKSDGPKSGIWLVNSDGKNPHLIVSGNWISSVDISPDRTKFLYHDSPGIWLSDFKGKDPRQIDFGSLISWLPDSQSFIFSDPDDQGQLYRVNLDGSGLARLSSELPASSARNLIFTPDGKTALFASECASAYCLYKLDIDSGASTQLTQPELGEVTPKTVSPDGRYVACFASGLIIVDINDANVIRINSDKESYSPNWSPDGKWLLFSNRKELYVVQPGGEPLWIRLTSDVLAGSFAP
jgi:Tol biopolymer transport system component